MSTPSQSLPQKTVFSIVFAIAAGHFINDLLQILIPSIYPLLKDNLALNFTQIGLITFVYQVTASLLQPVVGFVTDRRPQPYSQVIGMGFTSLGVAVLAIARSYHLVLISVAMIGVGSAIFHPESSRVAYLSAGGRRGLAQAIFQVGGNAGTALGPLLVILVVMRHGQHFLLAFLPIGALGVAVLYYVARWYKKRMISKDSKKLAYVEYPPRLHKWQVQLSVVILLVLIFSKFIYMASISSYFTFYLIDHFGVSIEASQFYLFLFLGAVALGTLLGGPLGDRFGRKYVIWFSILGSAPFALIMPYANLTWTAILVMIVGIVLSSAFPAILVYAQELLPRKIGMISGLFFGFAFGIGGLGSALLGLIADHTSIEFVYKLCALLPLIGMSAYFLPNVKSHRRFLPRETAKEGRMVET